MSSGGHLSRSLASLIRTIGQTRSKQQQDDIIRYQTQMLKVSLTLNPKQAELFEIMIKLLYIQTLGHDGSFAHIYPVNLCQSKSSKMKRLGYLLTTLCVNRNSKLSILMLSTIQKDLSGCNLHNMMYCLTALPKIINKTIVQGSLEMLIKLLKHPTDLVRKKTLLVLQKIYELQPECIPTYKTYLQEALFDEEPPVVFIAITLLKKLIQEDPDPYKEMTDDFCRILKDIIMHKYPKEYEYHRVPAPWMQVQILKVLALLGKNDPRTSHKIYDIVEKALRKSTYFQMHINNAIVVQAIKTISQLYPNPSLIRQAEEYIFRFFQKDNHNLMCFGIGCLTSLVKVDQSAVRHWQIQILECLESEDTTLATATVELLINIANDDNTATIINKLISLAEKQHDRQFQLNLIRKSLLLIQRFSATPLEYIQHMNSLFTKFQGLLDVNSVNNYIEILQDAAQNKQFAAHLVRQYSILMQNVRNVHILQVAAWVLGEYTEQSIGDLQSVEEIALMMMSVARRDKEMAAEWVVPAVIKLAQAEGFSRHQQVKQFLLELQASRNIRTHNIAEEFIRLAKFGPALKKSKALVAEKNPSFLIEYAQNNSDIKLIKCDSNKIPTKQTTQSELKFRPYKLQSPSKRYQPMMSESMVKQGTVALVQMQDDTILKFNGPRKWTTQGYQGPIPKPEPKPPASYIPQTVQQSQGFKPKGPQQRRQSISLSSAKQDMRKVNLAKSIFTGPLSK